MYCTVLYCTVLYCTVLYCTVLYCTVLYCTVLYCTVLNCTVLWILFRTLYTAFTTVNSALMHKYVVGHIIDLLMYWYFISRQHYWTDLLTYWFIISGRHYWTNLFIYWFIISGRHYWTDLLTYWFIISGRHYWTYLSLLRSMKHWKRHQNNNITAWKKTRIQLSLLVDGPCVRLVALPISIPKWNTESHNIYSFRNCWQTTTDRQTDRHLPV